MNATRAKSTYEVLQFDGHWAAAWKAMSLKAATAEAARITAEHFTATRVVEGELVRGYNLPEFAEVAYSGERGAGARQIVDTLRALQANSQTQSAD